jgi:signal transduction histidine kinase/CheY-like chemotaxis protein
MSLMVLFLSRYLSLPFMALWAAIYTTLQAVEFYGLSDTGPAGKKTRRVFCLALLLANSLVFGLPAIVWARHGGVLCMVCGAYLLSGAILNTVLMTRGSKAAFLASVSPFVAYIAGGALLAEDPQAGFGVFIPIGIAGALMSLSAITLWRESSMAYLKENATQVALTEREAELARALERAEEASRAKSAFLSVMSHELRTPLNGVVGMAQALSASGLPPHQADMVRTIERAGRSLSVILKDVLDLSKLTAGKLELHETEFDLAALLSDVVALFRGPAGRKGLAVRLQCDSTCMDVFKGDEHRLHQILSNLLSNAVKFTEVGEIRLDAAVEEADGRSRLIMTLYDTGAGIAADAQVRLFQSFSQGDASTAVIHSGTGLGLAIVRQLCRLMGGDVSVSSTPGRGAAFTVNVSLAKASRSVPSKVDHTSPTSTGRILVAEDNEMNRRVLSALLVNTGLDIDFVNDGSQAVKIYQERVYDLILMDVSMPVMTGIEATLAIRALESRHALPHTPIIALTANAMPEQIASCLNAGMDIHVAKPIDIRNLYAAIEVAMAHAVPTTPIQRGQIAV